MRFAAVLVLITAGTAHADDPRDIFGLKKKPEVAPVDCGDGTAFGCAGPTDPLDDVAPQALRSWLSAQYLLSLPVADSTHDAVTHYATGGARDDFGVSFGGASGLENRWTIDGAPADNARFGGVDTRIPLTFLRGIRTIAGGFAARDRASTGGIVDAQLLEGGEHHAVDVRAWGSLYGEPRRRSIPTGAYQLRRLYGDPGGDGTLSLVASGPLAKLAGGRAWYAAGIAPSIGRSSIRWEAKAILDTDGDHLADRNPDDGEIILAPIETDERPITSWFVPAMARVGWDRGPHHLAFSLVGHTERAERDLALSTIPAAGVERTTTTGDAIATYRGTWKTTRLTAQLAWHRSSRIETAADPAAADTPQRLTAYVPSMLPDDPDLAAACVDVDPTVFVRCPIPAGFFSSGGPGLLIDQTHDRPTASIDLAHHTNGNHVLRTGGTFEDTRVVTESSYTGGEQIRSLFPGHTDRARFHGTGTCSEFFDGECDVLAVSKLNYRTRYTAAYVEDTFHLSPNIAVDSGLRWELMWIGTAVHFSNQLSPRFGLSWDVLGNGRSRAFTSLGRSFAYLPAGIASYVAPGDRRVRDIMIANVGATRTLESGAPIKVDPNLQPATADEATAGIELGLPRAVHAIGWATMRRLRSMETTATMLTNPNDGNENAVRQTTTVAAEIATTGKTSLRLGYLYTRTVGSAVGLGDPRQGSTLFDGSDFDGETTNLFGRLPTDFGHRVFAEARRSGHLAGIPVAASLRLAANSGRPRDAISISGAGTAFLVPRGSYGRGPIIAQSNAEVSARVAGFDITLDVFNVFDRKEATATDDIYTFDVVTPIDHGTAQDLVFAKTESGRNVRRSTNFQYGSVFQSPIAATLGIRRSF